MKTIGFVDYYISEWHANNYPAWIKQVCEELHLSYEVKYAYAKVEPSIEDGKSTDEWCKAYNVTRCYSIKELCEKSDYIFLLAPSNPEKHLEFAKELFPCAQNKRIYIDKTFAPNLKEAKEIYSLAKKYHISFFSTSALRYSHEIKNINKANKVEVFGGGRSFEEYIIHQAEMLIKMMGTNIASVQVSSIDNVDRCEIKFVDGRIGYLSFSPHYDFAFKVDEQETIKIQSEFFVNLIRKILIFFETGEIDFAKDQTLAAMSLIESLIKSKENNGMLVNING